MDAFTVLAEPTRRTIVSLIARRGELRASEIGERFAASSPAISQHLKVLLAAEVLRVDKRGRQRFYRLNPSAMDEVEKWARETKELWNARLDRLDKLLGKNGRRQRGKNHRGK